MKPTTLLIALATNFALAIRIIHTNDDGWATWPVRRLHELMNETHDVVLSAPAENKSGNGDKEKEPKKRKKACQFDTCAPDSEPHGSDPEHPDLNWVNSYACTAMEWGIEKFGPEQWDGQGPDLAVSGINLGLNTWLFTPLSSTIAAAGLATRRYDIPSIAFSGHNKEWRPYWQVPVRAQEVYADLALMIIDQVLSKGKPYLPGNVMLNVNFPRIRPECEFARDFRFVLTRVNADLLINNDISWCGSEDLPTETSILDVGLGLAFPCTVAISPMDATDKTTINDHKKMRDVAEVLKEILSCPKSEWMESLFSWDALFGKSSWKDYIGDKNSAIDPLNHVED